MADTTHKAYTAAIASVLTTELNSLANITASGASAAIDNGTALDLVADITVTVATQASARSAGATIVIYIIQALDGTNYDDVNINCAAVFATVPFDAATTARQVSRANRDVPPGLFKLFAYNNTGQALAASGNLLEIRYHSVKSV